MKKYLFVTIAALLLISCGKSDLDFDKDDNFSQLGGDSTQIIQDTVGIHPFLGNKYFVINAKEQRLLYYASQKSMYSFKAIGLPESDNVSKSIYPQEIQDVMFDCSNNNVFLGYPASVEINGKPLIVVERRVSENAANEYSDGALLSLDSQSKWQLTDFFKYAPYGNSFMSTKPMIGKADAGKIVIKANIGVLLSDDNGQHWTHNPKAYDALDASKYLSLGANLVYCHKFGCMFFGTGHRKMPNDTVKSAIFEINTTTGEVSKTKHDWIPNMKRGDVDAVISEIGGPVFYVINGTKDPDLAAYDGYIIGFSVFKEKIYQFVYAYKPGDTWDDVKFSVAQTTIQGSLSRQSPPGVVYNPVTKMFEMIHSIPYELSLYSISPSNLLNNNLNVYGRAEWKKEASLLQRNITVRGQGMYPISSVIDTEKGVQRVFIDMGDEYPGRSGIFELTRTLKTSELAGFVQKKRAFIASQLY